MNTTAPTSELLEIFLVTAPGLEAPLADEARAAGFAPATPSAGGVTIMGSWAEVWRANLVLRGTVRVLVRLGSFRAMHLAQLDKRARKFEWGTVLRKDIPVRVEVTCKSSRIYHAKAATQRIETALTESHGMTLSPEAGIVIKTRIEDDLCTFSIDTSGESLHKRGHKSAVGKAPLRETMAAMFLRQMGFDGSQAVVDPMCGSGTICLEAAEIALGLPPGRDRAFAFQDLANFDQVAWQKMRSAAVPALPAAPAPRFFASDRDAGAVAMAQKNAESAGVADLLRITRQAVSDLTPPEGFPPGIVLVNPPYGARIGNRKLLFSLYGALSKTLLGGFSGWRVGVITSDGGLAAATGLPFQPNLPSVSHGGLKVTLHQTGPL